MFMNEYQIFITQYIKFNFNEFYTHKEAHRNNVSDLTDLV